jgi:hypothetical protein
MTPQKEFREPKKNAMPLLLVEGKGDLPPVTTQDSASIPSKGSARKKKLP